MISGATLMAPEMIYSIAGQDCLSALPAADGW